MRSDGERVVDRVPAFHADERRDLALLLNPLDVVGRERERERLRDTRHHAMDDVDLIERRGDGRAGPGARRGT